MTSTPEEDASLNLGPVPDPLSPSDDVEETAEISEDVPAAPFPYVDPDADQDDGSDFDADLG